MQHPMVGNLPHNKVTRSLLLHIMALHCSLFHVYLQSTSYFSNSGVFPSVDFTLWSAGILCDISLFPCSVNIWGYTFNSTSVLARKHPTLEIFVSGNPMFHSYASRNAPPQVGSIFSGSLGLWLYRS